MIKDINKRKIFSMVYIITCSIILLFEQVKLNEYDSMAIYIVFYMDISLLFLVVLNNGLDILFLFLFCLNYLLIPIMIQYFTGISYGVLAMNGSSLYMPEILIDVFIYSIVIIFLSLVTNFPQKEYSLVQLEENESNNITICFNNLIAIIFAIVAFPRLSIHVAPGDRFSMLLPGQAWNQLAIVALLFNLPYLRKRMDVKAAYLFVVMWFLLNGERADITGLILGLMIYYFMVIRLKFSKINIIKIILALGFVFIFTILLNYIVSLRNGNSSFSLQKMVSGILVTPTTADVGYLYNVSIDYFRKYGELNGRILESNILSIVPFSNPNGFDKIIESAHYFNPGGEPLLAEPIMDFGKLGLCIIAVIDFILLTFSANIKKVFFKKEFIVILCLIPRIVWYGRSYASTSVFFFVPVMFIADYLLNKIKGKGI